MGWVRALVCAAVLATGGGVAWGQPGTPLLQRALPPTEFGADSFEEAVLAAKEQYRLIVVYFELAGDPATKAMNERVWRNPTLAAHIRWHSVAYQTEYHRERGLANMLGICDSRDCPAVVVARVDNRKLEVLARMTTLRNPLVEQLATTGGTSHNRRQNFGLEINLGDIPDIYPGTLKVLQDTDTALEAVRARDPVWGEMHDERNPEPAPPPDPDPVYEIDDEAAPAVMDPEPMTGSPAVAGMIDVFDRLEEARGAAADGDLYLATGLYTWLWEKGAKADPAFRAVKRSALVEEMRALAMKRRVSKDRFLRLREYYDDRLLWTDYERLGDWFLLNGVVGDEMETVAYLDLFVNDLDEGSMLPDCDVIAYRLMVGRGYWNSGWDLGERPAPPPMALGSETRFKPVVTPVTQRAAQLVRMHAGGKGVGMDARDRQKIDAFRAVYMVDECARLHAGCLRVGRDDDAWRVAGTLLGARNDAESRLALVAAALAAGQVRAQHLAYLDEAAAEGKDHPVLRIRVTKAIEEAR